MEAMEFREPTWRDAHGDHGVHGAGRTWRPGSSWSPLGGTHMESMECWSRQDMETGEFMEPTWRDAHGEHGVLGRQDMETVEFMEPTWRDDMETMECMEQAGHGSHGVHGGECRARVIATRDRGGCC
jgi:hypothetical protein